MPGLFFCLVRPRKPGKSMGEGEGEDEPLLSRFTHPVSSLIPKKLRLKKKVLFK
jgi:hypothetical protein